MRLRRVPIRTSRPWLALYLVCIVLVLSFIFFEVLDVDGSDFPTSPKELTVKLAEPPHNDLRRALLQDAAKIGPSATVLVLDGSVDCVRLESTASPLVVTVAPSRRSPATLPRASLSDIPPAA